MHRRTFLGLLGTSLLKGAPPQRGSRPVNLKPIPFPSPDISIEDQFFLADLSKRSIFYFIDHASPLTGMVRDRAGNFPADPTKPNRSPASIGATGFCLAALCIGAEREYLPVNDAQEQVRRTLRYFAKEAYHNHGWFYHFMDPDTGEARLGSEVSSIDTALLVAGMLTARQYFRHDPEIFRLADTIYRRMDFQWMLNGDPHLLSHGWRPGSGFIKHRWDTYCEHMILYLLALGSPTYPLRPEAWYAWRRPEVNYNSYRYVSGSGPLFTHQYSHAWADFRYRREAGPSRINWFQNSVTATRANREFCMSLTAKYGYSAEVWGVTSSDSPGGYNNWGDPLSSSRIDGTVVPCAAGGSLMFAPDICLPALRAIKTRYAERLYHRYGFSDAFNPQTEWTDSDVLGIDVGITMLSAENLRTGNIWRWFMANPEIQRAMNLAKLEPG
jgi:hypothetical protein